MHDRSNFLAAGPHREHRHPNIKLLSIALFSIVFIGTGAEGDCGLYLAPSTIPGAGLGLFAGYDHDRGDIIGSDIAVPIVDYTWNNDMPYDDEPFLWDEYTWTSSNAEGAEEDTDDPDSISIASPGIGACGNAHVVLSQMGATDATLARSLNSSSPGVGAVSPFHERGFRVKKELHKGAEIFLDYGEAYFLSRPEKYGHVPKAKDYQNADRLLQKMKALERKLERLAPFPPSKSSSLDSRPVTSSDIADGIWELVLSSWPDSPMLNVLSFNRTQGYALLEQRGTRMKDAPRSTRSLEWLEENGQCMDNIKVAESIIPDAGKGAFANRFIKKGGLVAPSPLIHIPDKEVLRRFQPRGVAKGKYVPDKNRPSTYQLMMNYCFGQEESTLLLCPYGVFTSYINHSSERPNTNIQWGATMGHPEWKQWPIHEWGNEVHAGLSFDFVALRDIGEDEEILIDYGATWQRAWETHVKDFMPREDYMPSYELNDAVNMQYRTIEDKPYELDGVELWCRYRYIQTYNPESRKRRGKHERCRILQRTGENCHTVQLMTYTLDDSSEKTIVDKGKIFWGVPSDAFFFRDMPYSRDHLQFDAFRHSMMIPDEIFPNVWKGKDN